MTSVGAVTVSSKSSTVSSDSAVVVVSADFTDVSVTDLSEPAVVVGSVVVLLRRSLVLESTELEHAQTKNKNAKQLRPNFTGPLLPASLLNPGTYRSFQEKTHYLGPITIGVAPKKRTI